MSIMQQQHHDSNELSNKIAVALQRWGRNSPVSPEEYLKNILRTRGYGEIVAAKSPSCCRTMLDEKQLEDYSTDLLNAVRSSDLNRMRKLHGEGKSMLACNKYGESIFHLACRRSKFEVVKFMLENGANLRLVDDFNRSPLHDACWREDPNFEVVSLILDRDIDLLRMQDTRGSTPLQYVREEHWIHWCVYLHSHRDKYWPVRPVNMNPGTSLLGSPLRSLPSNHLASERPTA